MLVRVDEAPSPGGSAADGREELAALRGAAEEIAAAGGARLLRASTFGDAVPRELRLGPDELGRAYERAPRIPRAPEAGAGAWERVVSESIFADSKRLGELRALVADLLARADPRWRGLGAAPRGVLGPHGGRGRHGG